MIVFELVIALLFADATLAAWARRVNVPYPALLALSGAALALLPNAPNVALDPQLAWRSSSLRYCSTPPSIPLPERQNRRAVTGLALIAVGVRVAAVATAVLCGFKAPHRIFVILEQAVTSLLTGGEGAMMVSETPTNDAVNFVTGAGGFLQQVIYGYTGLRLAESGLDSTFAPVRPSRIRRLVLRNIRVHGQAYDVVVDSSGRRTAPHLARTDR